MRIFEKNLIELATAYIEDGVLKKWRFDSHNPNDMKAVLNKKAFHNMTVTKEELDYIKQFPNVVIVNKHYIQFVNFSGTAISY